MLVGKYMEAPPRQKVYSKSLKEGDSVGTVVQTSIKGPIGSRDFKL